MAKETFFYFGEETLMNRVVILTVALLVAAVGFAVTGEEQEANAGLFNRKCCSPEPSCCAPEPRCHKNKHRCGGKREGLFARLRARKCNQATCCAPEPTCCAPEPTCCAPAPSCGGCDSGCGGCDSCGGAVMQSNGSQSNGSAQPEAAPAAPEAPEAPEAPADSTT